MASKKKPTLVLTPKKKPTMLLTKKKFLDPTHMNPNQIASARSKKKST